MLPSFNSPREHSIWHIHEGGPLENNIKKPAESNEKKTKKTEQQLHLSYGKISLDFGHKLESIYEHQGGQGKW